MSKLVPPLQDVVRKGACIKVYTNERSGATTTEFTAGIAIGLFVDGLPVISQCEPKNELGYDFYLGDTKVKFEKPINPQMIVSRRVGRGVAPHQPRPYNMENRK